MISPPIPSPIIYLVNLGKNINYLDCKLLCLIVKDTRRHPPSLKFCTLYLYLYSPRMFISLLLSIVSTTHNPTTTNTNHE